MKKVPSPRGLLVYPALLSIWLSISCAALFYTDIKTAMAGILILAALAAATLGIFSIALIYGINIITIIVYLVMINVLYGLHPSSILLMITFVTAEIGTAFLAWNTNKQFLSVNNQVERDKTLIDEMRINDEKTGLMRFHYARRVISNEIARGLRYNKKFSILLMRVENWDGLAEAIGLEPREALLVEICDLLFAGCRNVDILFINMDKIGILLPETDRSGARIIAQRLVDIVLKKTKQTLHAGIVCFPDDSITEDDLIRKAELALKFGDDNQLTLNFYQDIVFKEDGFTSITPESENNLAEIEDSEDETSELTGKITDGETAVHFCGIHNLTDLEKLQKAIERIPDIGEIRLIDYSENEIIFGVKMKQKDLSEKLLHDLPVTNISIEERLDSIVIRLDPSTEIH